jgi:hypothetical protein
MACVESGRQARCRGIGKGPLSAVECIVMFMICFVETERVYYKYWRGSGDELAKATAVEVKEGADAAGSRDACVTWFHRELPQAM